MLITNGLVRVLWMYLTPPVFEYSANCDRHGRPLTSEPVKSEALECTPLDSECGKYMCVCGANVEY
jgi:hypothetical protein